ncbi:MAG: hypothetical protein HQK77_15610 [Desulfobacterales bacterium]|nr:hypothetical protein [Desulfobacterales bacterium]
MKNKNKWICLLFIMWGILSASTLYAEGMLKLVVRDRVIEPGEELAIYLLLNGSENYDVYAALTGGALQDQVFMVDQQAMFIPFNPNEPLPKLRDNLNLSQLSIKDKIITLIPKFLFKDTVAFQGMYTFYGVLCSPGTLNFIEVQTVQVEIK